MALPDAERLLAVRGARTQRLASAQEQFWQRVAAVDAMAAVLHKAGIRLDTAPPIHLFPMLVDSALLYPQDLRRFQRRSPRGLSACAPR